MLLVETDQSPARFIQIGRGKQDTFWNYSANIDVKLFLMSGSNKFHGFDF